MKNTQIFENSRKYGIDVAMIFLVLSAGSYGRAQVLPAENPRYTYQQTLNAFDQAKAVSNDQLLTKWYFVGDIENPLTVYMANERGSVVNSIDQWFNFNGVQEDSKHRKFFTTLIFSLDGENIYGQKIMVAHKENIDAQTGSLIESTDPKVVYTTAEGYFETLNYRDQNTAAGRTDCKLIVNVSILLCRESTSAGNGPELPISSIDSFKVYVPKKKLTR